MKQLDVLRFYLSMGAEMWVRRSVHPWVHKVRIAWFLGLFSAVWAYFDPILGLFREAEAHFRPVLGGQSPLWDYPGGWRAHFGIIQGAGSPFYPYSEVWGTCRAYPGGPRPMLRLSRGAGSPFRGYSGGRGAHLAGIFREDSLLAYSGGPISGLFRGGRGLFWVYQGGLEAHFGTIQGAGCPFWVLCELWEPYLASMSEC